MAKSRSRQGLRLLKRLSQVRPPAHGRNPLPIHRIACQYELTKPRFLQAANSVEYSKTFSKAWGYVGRTTALLARIALRRNLDERCAGLLAGVNRVSLEHSRRNPKRWPARPARA